MSDTRYLAIAFSSRIANGHLRTAVTAAAPADAKVVRTRSDVVAAVFEVDEDVDARSEGERLRRRVSKDADDDQLSVAVSGPKRGATGAHLALLQAEQAVSLVRTNGGRTETHRLREPGPLRVFLRPAASEVHG